jgi:cullin-4
MLQSKGMSVVADPEKDKQMVTLLLELKDVVDTLMERAFNRNDAFVYVGKQAFEKIMNARDNKPAELIGVC